MYKSRWTEKTGLLLAGLLGSNIVFVYMVMLEAFRRIDLSVVFIILASVVSGVIWIGLSIWLHTMPFSRDRIPGRRLRVLMGGRRLIRLSLSLTMVSVLLYMLPTYYWTEMKTMVHDWIWTYSINLIVMAVYIFALYTNGWIRILASSRRLGPSVRVICGLLIYIPLVHLIVDGYLCRMALTEADHEINKKITDDVRLESQVCATKYPLLLLHGVGFRDLKYLNYWGRVPRELIKNGATIEYGNQEAWGTIEANGEDIRNRILEMTGDTGYEKVNIIAHSKGGLDARYAVSRLGVSDRVASVTMIGTPHRGSAVIDFVYRLPEGLVRFIGNRINGYFGMLGDKNPDFHVASKQFLTARSSVFNEETPDMPGIYYQSYATKMRNLFSDPLLTLPYLIVRIMEGPNDGLVNVDSAKWGDFRGIVASKKQRGISHGDIIDLKREDYSGFDVREFYVNLVGELKEKGY